ncbi:hypothetical protein DZF91_21510 [Actinomadura logoneensis]|uniref:Uncharacterized protein n=1 Tax=Actinomadura logoneensis TaxID=2293572 RepID=A0A372JI38_9ACTN|nr:hypothetical protein DZF91_21510 [Actinomadura logoneensis]
MRAVPGLADRGVGHHDDGGAAFRLPVVDGGCRLPVVDGGPGFPSLTADTDFFVVDGDER